MSRPQSRARREAAFMKEAKRMYEQLEAWYDKHPEASFPGTARQGRCGEIEAEARKRRRELMGRTLAQLVNGRDMGMEIEAPGREKCGEETQFEASRIHFWLKQAGEIEIQYKPHKESNPTYPVLPCQAVNDVHELEGKGPFYLKDNSQKYYLIVLRDVFGKKVALRVWSFAAAMLIRAR